MRFPRQTWVRLSGEAEYHAVSAVVFGKLWIGYCGKQWPDTADAATGEHDKNDRCWVCQGRVIEANRVGVGLDELERAVLWDREMVDA